MSESSSARRHRRPALLDPGSMDAFAQDRLDPAVISQIAHETAAILVRTGRASTDPEMTERLVRLVDELGLDTVAQLWSECAARTLPGTLWRLYVIREWVRRDPVGASGDFAEGMRHADVSVAIAGAGSPPGPVQMKELADAILRGVYTADVAVALERAAAFCRIVAAGRASREPDISTGRGPLRSEPVTDPGSRHAASAAAVLTMSDDLAWSAKAWRRSDLV
ncbi:hypothetical protein [Austwickia chelonae]|uniref:hypothetical protein n=1 Tax=Austwickia chelonae TaxID=100225 RepID=UPI001F07A184|nr:hypothetical protein [Austwickia chelonae]